MRVFDALACGGFVLAEYSAELAQCFDLGREVIAWRNPAELRALTSFYLGHPDKAAAVAARGRDRVLRDHTVAARVARMLAA
jgi:spore maturation protein CgeB